MLEDKDGYAILHEPSSADRRPATASKGHFTGHILVGPWPGRVLYTESYLEHSWAHCLNADLNTRTLREQVAFEWQDNSGKRRTHYFDLFVEQVDGTRLACPVKPKARVTPKFEAEIALIARQAVDSGFADDVRLLTDVDLDPVELSNARLIYSARKPDAEADEATAAVIAQMGGISKVSELAAQIEHGARGYRALIRCIGRGRLRTTRHQRIAPEVEVFHAGEAQ
ncbi:MAG: hypothetical protein MEQ74_14705 [Paracoccus sp.]|nr:hypothetical protein [Paracoccus sp. (in: a-proteobacteria)]